jgi:hypothetical protein
MARYGLGNFLYDIEVRDGNAEFNFFDPEDAENTAQVTIAQKDFAEGLSADSRQVADQAYAEVEKQLNDKRDARIKREAVQATTESVEEEARARAAAADFHNNAQDLADTTPSGGQGEAPREQKAPPHNAQSQDSVADQSQKSNGGNSQDHSKGNKKKS